MTTTSVLQHRGLSTGKQARLHHMLYEHGLKNGSALFLPYDQGFEHGPRDFFENPLSADPHYIFNLAIEGGFNAIAIQIGLAEKFYGDYAGHIPLILKLNGKTDFPQDNEALSPVQASVEDAVRLGASAVGYTLYVGSPAQERDFAQLKVIREDAERLGMPLIVWSYPRGEAVNAKGGSTSFYAVDYAARAASELGADMVKVNFPHPDLISGVKAPYEGTFSTQEAIDAVVRSANRSMVLISGGEKSGEDVMFQRAREARAAGATGFIFGRNVWQRPYSESLKFIAELQSILA